MNRNELTLFQNAKNMMLASKFGIANDPENKEYYKTIFETSTVIMEGLKKGLLKWIDQKIDAFRLELKVSSPLDPDFRKIEQSLADYKALKTELNK